MTPEEKQIRHDLATDFAHYAEKCLKIRDGDSGALTPFVLNRGQRHLHDAIERQRAETGKVRTIVLKARQWGCSTYVEGRFYWLATHRPGVRAFILTHERDATDTLFDMARRFHDHCPEPVRPHTGVANAKELVFDLLDSGYRVGTAGAKEVGRSQNLQLFHGSEVAFWPFAETHAPGVLRAVSDAPGTEIILESTANGIGGLFYNYCQDALRGRGDYQLVFVPWHMVDKYRSPAPAGWAPSAIWRDYGQAHGLSVEQLHWAFRTNMDLARASGADPDEPCWMFMQEYPATVDEAFQAGGTDTFIRPEVVLQARKNQVPDQRHMPLILGVDVARGGGDKTRIIDRQGRCAGYTVNEEIDSDDLMDVAGRVARFIERYQPDAVFVDITGLGAGVYDALKARKYRMLHAVNFGSKPADPERYANKRAEMWARMREWFEDEGGADIPDEEAWQIDICAPGFKYDNYSRTLLESKEDIRKRLGFSPDIGDALACTFAETVAAGALAAPKRQRRINTDYDPFTAGMPTR